MAVALLLALGAAGVELWLTPDAPPAGDQLARFPLPLGPRVRSTGTPAISPDGTTIVYSASEGLVASEQLFVRRIDQIRRSDCPVPNGYQPIHIAGRRISRLLGRQQLKRTRLDAPPRP